MAELWEAIAQGLAMGGQSLADRLDKREEFKLKRQLAQEQQDAMLNRMTAVQGVKNQAAQDQLSQMASYADQLEAQGDPESIARAQSIRQAVALGGAKQFGQFQKAYNDTTLMPAKKDNLMARTGLVQEQTEGQQIKNNYQPQIYQGQIDKNEATIENLGVKTEGQKIENEYKPQVIQNKIQETNSRIVKNNAQTTNTNARTVKTRQDIASPSGGGRSGSKGAVSYMYDPSGQYITGEINPRGQIKEYRNPIPKTAIPSQAAPPKPKKSVIPRSNIKVSLGF